MTIDTSGSSDVFDTPDAPAVDLTGKEESEKAKPSSSTSFVVAPIPSRSPTLGVGLALVGGVIFRVDPKDTASPPSMVGLGVFRTENGSQGAGLGGKLYLKEDRHRVTAMAFSARIYYDFFLDVPKLGAFALPLEITTKGGKAEWLYRVAPKYYLGMTLVYARADTRLKIGEIELPWGAAIPEPQLKATISSLGAHMQRDTRDDTIDPKAGSLLDLTLAYDRKAWGSSFDYQVGKATYKQFLTHGDRHTLGLEAFGRFAGGDVPFYALSYYGSGSHLRGYTTGTKQRRMLATVQAEYRFRWTRRWGLVGFAGTGKVFQDFSKFSRSDWLPGYGVGIRFALSKKHRLNFRVDYAWDKKGNGALYIAVGEAF